MEESELNISTGEIVPNYFGKATKKIKLRINIDGIVRAIKSIDSMAGPEEDAAFLNGRTIANLSALKYILDTNLKIESVWHSSKEKKDIADIVKNVIYQFLVYEDLKKETISLLIFDGMEDTLDEAIKRRIISLINRIIRPNTVIGSYIRYDLDEDVDNSVSTMVYTLELAGGSSPLNLKYLLRSTAESLDRDILCDVSTLVYPAYDLEKYTPIQKYYSVDDLYIKKHKGSGMALVDYGLRFIHKNFHEINVLTEKIEKNIASSDSSDLQEITDEVNKIFKYEEDLRIFISISNNINKIRKEKKIHTYMFKTLEYLANSTSLLEEEEGLKKLKVKSDLSDFGEKYVLGTVLSRIVDGKAVALFKEIERNRKYLEADKKTCKELENNLQHWIWKNHPTSHNYQKIKGRMAQEIERLKYDISILNNNVSLLESKLEKENFQAVNIQRLLENLQLLCELNPTQKKYIVRRLKEFGNKQSIEVEVEEEKEKEAPIAVPIAMPYVLSDVAADVVDNVREERKPSSTRSTSSGIAKIATALGCTIAAAVAVFLLASHVKSRMRIIGADLLLAHRDAA
ncbi:hypothetical protein NEMIN01_2408 [Nematocida minor]|uniref:uncharacterized protein n=1 Tax=Nematocida minor TaxID=1912983 RepID=UPI00222047B7|nr:uncharacterized protein NEMIN01_2408 [Nematocida minor]KAI5193201.1 hypothetical protein NEMIN01_2408 [Nematocida minor]